MAVINRETALFTGKRFASQIRSEIDKKALVLLFGSCAKNEATERQAALMNVERTRNTKISQSKQSKRRNAQLHNKIQ